MQKHQPEVWIAAYERQYKSKDDSELIIEFGRILNGVPFRTAQVIHQDAIGMRHKEFNLFSKLLGHTFEAMTVELDHFITRRLNGTSS